MESISSNLNFAFLEGGVHWACGVFSDIVGHWKKRNAKAIHNLDPQSLDGELMRRLIDEHGTDRMKGKADEIVKWVAQPQRRPKNLDDWAACRVEKLEDLRDLFVPNFYYGCEADDPMVAWAFNSKVNPMGVKLKAMMSSDIGHWDVTEMNEVVEEAHELVDDGLITEEDFRDYTFTNAATLYAGKNPDFFKGTACEVAVAKLLRSPSPRAEQAVSA